MSRLFDALKKIEGAGGKGDDAEPASTLFSGASQAPAAPPWWRKRIVYYLLFFCFTVMLGCALLIYLHGIAHNNSVLTADKPSSIKSPLGQGENAPVAVLPTPVSKQQVRLQTAAGEEPGAGVNVQDPGVLVAGVRNVEKKLAIVTVHHEVNGGSQPGFQASPSGVSGIRKTKKLTQRDKERIPVGDRGRFSVTEKKLLQQAEELRNAGKIQAAMAIYRKLWNKNPTPEVGNNLAACYMISGLYQEARQVLEKSLKLSPGDPDLLYNLRIVSRRLQAHMVSPP